MCPLVRPLRCCPVLSQHQSLGGHLGYQGTWVTGKGSSAGYSRSDNLEPLAPQSAPSPPSQDPWPLQEGVLRLAALMATAAALSSPGPRLSLLAPSVASLRPGRTRLLPVLGGCCPSLCSCLLDAWSGSNGQEDSLRLGVPLLRTLPWRVFLG